jgi:hypothetical protein
VTLFEHMEPYFTQIYADVQSSAAPYKNLIPSQQYQATTAPQKLPPEIEDQSAAHKLAMCLIDASHFYHVPPAVMIGILHVEGGRVGRESGPNADGSYDLGPMQINTQWLPELARAWKVDVRKARTVMRDDGCMNVKAAAWILHNTISDAGSVYGGIARYNSSTPGVGSRYAAKVEKAMEEKGLIRRN